MTCTFVSIKGGRRAGVTLYRRPCWRSRRRSRKKGKEEEEQEEKKEEEEGQMVFKLEDLSETLHV